MSVRMRITSSKTRSRRSHHNMDGPTLTVDSVTGSARRRHFAHPGTGEYRGKQILFKAASATSPTSAPNVSQKETKKDADAEKQKEAKS